MRFRAGQSPSFALPKVPCVRTGGHRRGGSTLPGCLLETIGDNSTLEPAFTDGSTFTLLGRSTAAISEDGQKPCICAPAASARGQARLHEARPQATEAKQTHQARFHPEVSAIHPCLFA
jgi:hypothetical protein